MCFLESLAIIFVLMRLLYPWSRFSGSDQRINHFKTRLRAACALFSSNTCLSTSEYDLISLGFTLKDDVVHSQVFEPSKSVNLSHCFLTSQLFSSKIALRSRLTAKTLPNYSRCILTLHWNNQRLHCWKPIDWFECRWPKQDLHRQRSVSGSFQESLCFAFSTHWPIQCSFRS